MPAEEYTDDYQDPCGIRYSLSGSTISSVKIGAHRPRRHGLMFRRVRAIGNSVFVCNVTIVRAFRLRDMHCRHVTINSGLLHCLPAPGNYQVFV